MNGLDGMIRVIVKAIGIDPEQLLQSITGFMHHVYEQLAGFDRRMVEQEAMMRRLLDAQEQLLRLYNARPELRVITGGPDSVAVHGGPIAGDPAGGHNDTDNISVRSGVEPDHRALSA